MPLLPEALPPVVYTGKVTGSGLVCETWLPSISWQPSSFIFPFLFPPFWEGSCPQRRCERHTFVVVHTEELTGPFFPRSRRIKDAGIGVGFWAPAWRGLAAFLAWTSSGKPISTFCAMTPASDYAAHF